jgi:hypothetical protein
VAGAGILVAIQVAAKRIPIHNVWSGDGVCWNPVVFALLGPLKKSIPRWSASRSPPVAGFVISFPSKEFLQVLARYWLHDITRVRRVSRIWQSNGLHGSHGLAMKSPLFFNRRNRGSLNDLTASSLHTGGCSVNMGIVGQAKFDP